MQTSIFDRLIHPAGVVAGLLAALALAGCGGSSGGGTSIGGGTSTGGKPVTTNSGPLAITASIALPPIFMGGRNAAIFGFAGGSITNATAKLAPLASGDEKAALANTFIAYDEGGQTKIYNFGTKASFPIGSAIGPNFSTQPSFSGVGNRLAVSQKGTDGASNQVFTEAIDGSGRVAVGLPIPAAAASNLNSSPAYSPDGSKVAYLTLDPSGKTRLAIVNAGGGSSTFITAATETPANPVWTPDSRSLVYASQVAGQTGWILEFIPATAGATPIQLIAPIESAPQTTFLGGDVGDALISFRKGNTSCIARLDGGGGPQLLFSTTDTINGISGSPVGKFLLIGDSTTNTINLLNCDLLPRTPVPLITGTGPVQSPNWGPFSGTKTLVGSGGAFGATSGAILYGAAGPMVGGIVSVDAATESSISVQAQGNTNPTQSIIFAAVSGTNLTSLKYMNDLDGAVVTPFSGTAPGVSNALISFDADTGDVLSVVTSSSSLARTGGSFSGKILGAFDAKGKNIAPNGARSVVFDEHSGKLLSAR